MKINEQVSRSYLKEKGWELRDISKDKTSLLFENPSTNIRIVWNRQTETILAVYAW